MELHSYLSAMETILIRKRSHLDLQIQDYDSERKRSMHPKNDVSEFLVLIFRLLLSTGNPLVIE